MIINVKPRHTMSRGFTLIELMITVAIIAILASIAVPSYQQHVIRGNRSAAQAEMMDIANRQRQFFLANRSYATTLAELGYSAPTEITSRYLISDAGLGVNNAATPPSFNITFTAQGAQTSDGNLTLNSQGVKGPAGKW